jgi:hypothetical protein
MERDARKPCPRKGVQVNRRAAAFIVSLTLAGSACLATAAPSSAATAAAAPVPGAGAWTPTSNGLSLVRYSFRASTLPDGRVLAEGGFAPGSYTPEAETYDPATNAWTVVSPMNQGRGEQSATLLADGRVLVAGGYAGPVLSSAEIFDPSTGQWQVTGSMHVNRTRQAAVRLCDGRVLVVGGWNGQGISSAETYDPSTGLWTLTPGSLPVLLQNPGAFLLPDCTVLVTGGSAGTGSTPSAAAWIFDPGTGTFTATASMHHARTGFGGAQLQDGRVLIMGGNTPGSSTTAEVFNPANRQWSDVAPMNDPHTLGFGEDPQTLPDGRVLVPGDNANGLEAELYDPATDTWSFTGPQYTVHYGGVTALLRDGRVLNAGGMNSSGTLTPTGETYAPGPAVQAISFTGPRSGAYGSSAALTATGGGSGNPVTFSVDPSSTPGACAVSGASGSTLTYTGTGNCVIDANQVGNSSYAPALQVQQAVQVSPAPLTITASSPTMTLGSEPPVISPVYSGFTAGDSPASLTAQPVCTTTAASTSPLGTSYAATCSGASDPDYQISYAQGEVIVVMGSYVSMGDSFSSGEGNGSYDLNGNTDTTSDMCHRSENSYPVFLFNADPLSAVEPVPGYVACSGAESTDFLYPNHKYRAEPAQINAVHAGTNVVTFTIGGNDAGFADVLKQCIHVQGAPDPSDDNKGYNCSRKADLANQIKRRIAALQGLSIADNPDGNPIIPISVLLQDIYHKAPLAAIFVAGYPHLFGPSTAGYQADKKAPSQYTCQVGPIPLDLSPATIDYTDAQWLNSETDALNKAIAAAVSSAQAAGVPAVYVGTVPQLFQTHGLCDSGTPWFYKLSVNIVHKQPDPWSFHPTQDGQHAYETAFAGQ